MKARTKEIMSGVLGVNVEEISDSFGPEDAEGWDSLRNLMLISALESEFDIQLTMSEIQGMSTFALIESTISSKIG